MRWEKGEGEEKQEKGGEVDHREGEDWREES